MRFLWLLVPIVFLASCSENPCRCVSPDEPACRDWPVLADSMNLAVLVLDYLTYTFEGGNLAYYEPCDGCDSDSLPFTVDFKPTWDFASILFTYKATGDTLFWAEIIWHGGGQILYPVAFTPADSFCTLSDSIAEPADPERFQFYPTLPPEELITKTDSTWAAVSTLDIVHAFAEGDFKVAYYFYPPAVGAFNPAVAKWIVFLYRGRPRYRHVSCSVATPVATYSNAVRTGVRTLREPLINPAERPDRSADATAS